MNEIKPILSIETSESLCGVCVYFDDNKYFETNVHLKNAHAEKLFAAINSTLDAAKTDIIDIGAIAVSNGPGSFTGLRIGMSAAKGLAFAANIPIIPVPTFEALALQISTYNENGKEFIIANKVNSEEIYYAKFQIKSNNYIFVDNLSIIKREEFSNIAKNALIFGNVKIKNDDNKEIQIVNIATPNPFYVAKWGRLFGTDLLTYNYDYLEPNYLKNFIIKVRKNA